MPYEEIPGQRIRYVGARWRFLVMVIAVSACLAFIVSELLPRKYTATTTVIIDPPATTDIHAGAALNPAYLDSLRTYEHFFTSDQLFDNAARRFHLDLAGQNVATIREQVLKVKQQHETRILEISATMRDPAAAYQLARYITEQSIEANREHAEAADRDSMKNLLAELETTRAQLTRAQAEWQRASKDDTPDAIQVALDSAVSLQSDTRTHQNEAEAEAEEWRIRAEDGQDADKPWARTQARAAAARRDDYAKRLAQLDAEVARDRKELAERSSRLTLATSELDVARKAFETAQTRVRDFAAVAGMRTERMRIIDPGVVPRKPSSPKVLLNTLAAALLAACLGLGWLVLRASEARPKPAVVRTTQRLA